MKGEIIGRLRKMKKEQILVVLLLLGLALVVIVPTKEKKEPGASVVQKEMTGKESGDGEQFCRQFEKQLVESLSQASGVGRVSVSVTLENLGKRIVEKDVPREASSESSQEASSKSEREEETTVYEKDGEGKEMPYVVEQLAPQIRGVLVVAEGGDSPQVQQQIREAVQALFHIEAHKIKVMKMK